MQILPGAQICLEIKMTPKERALGCIKRHYAFDPYPTYCYWENTVDGFPGIGKLIEEAIIEAVKEERIANANLAWEMQSEQFGGGSAIGNAIQDGKRAERR